MIKVENCYKGIVYRRTSKGTWVFDTLPANKGHWSRYFTDADIDIISNPNIPVKEQQNIMEAAIDKMLAKNPTYTGDLRCQGASTEMNKVA